MADAKQMARVFMTEMQGAVASDEADPMSRMGRRIKRNWKHGDLKKKTTKVAIGVGVGIITVSASAATGGLALPVILAVAAGTYTVGQLTSGGIAVGWGRQRRGREGTRSWMDAYRAQTPDGQVDKMFGLEQRVHKTIRRALQHYHKAGRKFRTDLEAARLQARDTQDCESARALLLGMFSVDHHLHKTHVYLEPAAWLCVLLLDTYETCAQAWSVADGQAETSLTAHFHAHGGKRCNSADVCLVADDYDFASVPPASGAPSHKRWDAAAIKERRDKLAVVTDRLKILHSMPPVPPPDSTLSLGTKGRVQVLLEQAGRDYTANKGVGIRIMHYAANNWARRTKREQVAFGIGQGAGAALSVGGAVSGGLTAGIDLAPWVDPVQEFGSQALGLGADSAIDQIAEHGGSSNAMDIDRRNGAAAVGSESQEVLMKASIHMQEVLRLMEKLRAMPRQGDCDDMVAGYFALYQLEHHLDKTARYLDEAITQVTAIGGALQTFDALFNGRVTSDVYTAVHKIVGGSHEYCDAKSRCFGPHSLNPGRPVRPVV